MSAHRRQPVGSAAFAGCPGSLPPATLTPPLRGPLGSLPHPRCTSTGFREEAPAVSGRARVAGRHRQAPTPRPAPRTYLLRAEVPAQAAAAAGALRHCLGGSFGGSGRPSVPVSRAGETVASLGHPETTRPASRHAPQDSGLESRGGYTMAPPAGGR